MAGLMIRLAPATRLLWLGLLTIALFAAPIARSADPTPYITWFNPPKVAHPLTSHRSYQSAAMKTKVGYRIYVPPGYDEPSGASRYPVLYWLHGRTGTEANDSFPIAVIDRAIRDGKVPPMIVVYACGGQLSWYADSPDGVWMAETTVIRELIPHIDATYRTIPERRARAIQGMSMGGYGAVKFAMKYPDLFSSVVAFAGSFRSADELVEMDKGLVFKTMFGGDKERFDAQHPATLARLNAERFRTDLKLKLLMGTNDKPVLLAAHRRFHELLTELKIPHEYTEIEGIEHNLPKLAEAVKTEAIEFSARHFNLAPRPADVAPQSGLFARDNLVAWCIVPFDGKNRTPEQRALMLKELGFKRYAYDWRAQHLPTFEAEIKELQNNGVTLQAVWFPASLNADARTLLDVLKRNNVKTELWVSLTDRAPKATEQSEKVAATADAIRPIAVAAAEIGCKVGLYNHGGWGGEPENQLAVAKALAMPNVGIVYNLHHGHEHVDRLKDVLPKLAPHLLAINLNGMVRGGDKEGKKIVVLGQGDLDLEILKTIQASGYAGPIGILGHTQDDAEARLKDNLDGLDWLLPQLQGKPAGTKPTPRTAAPK